MKKISLKGLTEVLNEKELKGIMAGSGIYGCNGCLSTPFGVCFTSTGTGRCFPVNSVCLCLTEF